MAFVVTKNAHVDHNDIADMFAGGAYHEDQAALLNAIGKRLSGEPKHLTDIADKVAKHLDDSGRSLIRALAEATVERGR